MLRAISPFPAVFSKDLYCRHVKTRACSGKGSSYKTLVLMRQNEYLWSKGLTQITKF